MRQVCCRTSLKLPHFSVHKKFTNSLANFLTIFAKSFILNYARTNFNDKSCVLAWVYAIPHARTWRYFMNRKKDNRIVLRLNDEQMRFIKEVAKENGISALNAVRLVIARYKEGQRYGR